MSKQKKVTIYVTKYALTKGIEKATGSVERLAENMILFKKEGQLGRYYMSGEYHLSEIEALERAEEMRQKKLKSLRAQIKKLEGMVF